MTENSLLCNFMKEHSEDWEALLRDEKKLFIRKDEQHPLVLFHYQDFQSDMKDPLVQEARGIIIRTDTLDVVCWPFNKFFDYDDPNAPDLDYSQPIYVAIKQDGSLLNYWWNPFTSKWQASTRSVINAYDALTGSFDHGNEQKTISFGELFHSVFTKETETKVERYFDRGLTYMFELCSPYNKVVVPYEKLRICHIGTRSNVTGTEFYPSLPYLDDLHPFNPYPFRCTIRLRETVGGECKESLIEETMRKLSRLELLEKDLHNGPSMIEGVVLMDANFRRWKVKTKKWYLLDSITTATSGRRRAIEFVRDPKNREDLMTLMCMGVKEAAALSHYFAAYASFCYEATEVFQFARAVRPLIDQGKVTRAEVAETMIKSQARMIGFSALNTDKTVEELLAELSTKKLMNVIPPFDDHFELRENKRKFYEKLKEDTNDTDKE